MITISLEDLTSLEEKVHITLERYSSLRPKERQVAWNLSQRLKEHHLFTYVDSLNVALTTRGIMKAAIELRIPEIKGITEFLPRTGLYGGLLHDIGKLETPLEILDKTYGIGIEEHGSYSLEDHEEMKKHPEAGREILRRHGLLMSAWIALLHHPEYPPRSEIPSYPKEFSQETIKHLEFATKAVSLADQYIAYHRPNKMHGNRPLNPRQIKQKLTEGNLDYADLIDKLYKNHVFVLV